MSETALRTNSQELRVLHGLDQFPDLRSLQDHMREEMLSYTPFTVEETGWHEHPDVKIHRIASLGQQLLIGSDLGAESIGRRYVASVIDTVHEKCWWLRDATPQDYEGLDTAPIIAAHGVTMTYKGELLPESYTIYEAGEPALQGEIETVVNAMALIDQCTGGALVSGGRHPRIILYDNDPRIFDDGDAYDLGITNAEFTVIYTRSIRTVAEAEGIDYHAALAQTIFHEIGGHRLDNQFGKDGGGYFAQFFRYKKIIDDSKRSTSIRPRCNVTAKDPTRDTSFPVNSYGTVDEYEDLATTAEQQLAGISNIILHTNNFECFSFDRHDNYRTDILIGLFNLAASAVSLEYGHPGFVGCEFEYKHDENGKTTQTPSREFTVKTMDGPSAIAYEIHSIIQAAKKPTLTFAQKLFSKKRR